MQHHPTRLAGSTSSDNGRLIRRAIRAALLTGAGSAAGLVATAHASHAATLSPSAPPPTSSSAVAPASPADPGGALAAQPSDPTIRRLAVRATAAPRRLGAAPATTSAPAPVVPAAATVARSADRTEGGAIGGIEVTGPTSTAAPSPATAPTPTVDAPGGPAATAASEVGPATIVPSPATDTATTDTATGTAATDPGAADTTSAEPAGTDTAPAGTTGSTTGSTPAVPGDASVGNNSDNTAVASQPVDVTVVDQQPIVIVGATGDTTINITLGGTVSTTVTAVATNTSDGSASVTTGIDAQTTSQVQVTSSQPVTVSSSAGPISGTAVVTGNSSRNVAVVSQAPHVAVVQSIPIVLVHPDGRVTINTVIAGVVVTRVVGVATNSSNGQGALTGGAGQAVATGNESTNQVIVIQTPDITVVFTIPITIVDPQGPVDIHALIAGVVDTQVTAIGTNQSSGTAITDGTAPGGAGTAVHDGSSTDRSSNAVMIVQAPSVSLLQQVPITITNPAAPVHIDATIASLITTTLQAAAGNSSSGTLVTDGASFTTHSTDGTIQVLQAPMVQVDSSIPVTVHNPSATVQISTLVADAVRTVVHQTIGAGDGAFGGGGSGVVGIPPPLVSPPPPVSGRGSGSAGGGSLPSASAGQAARAATQTGRRVEATSARLAAIHARLTGIGVAAATSSTAESAPATAESAPDMNAVTASADARAVVPTGHSARQAGPATNAPPASADDAAWWRRDIRSPYFPIAVLAAGLAVAGLRRRHLLRLLRRSRP